MINAHRSTAASAAGVATPHVRAVASVTAAATEAEDHHTAARQWVESLLEGACTEGDFLTQIMLLLDEEPDLAWEVLAMLDQHYRRHSIGDDAFKRVKARLQQECLGYGASPASPRTAPDSAPVPDDSDAFGVTLQRAPPRTRRRLEPPRHRLHSGDVLKGRYRVVEVRPRSEASVSIEAFDNARTDLPEVRQRVSITLLSDELSRDLGLVQRIYRLQALSHRCIPRIFDIDEDDGELFFTSEWITSIALQSMLHGRHAAAPGVSLAWSALGCVADALTYAHAHGVAHGNVQLQNVQVTESGEVRLHGFVLDENELHCSTLGDVVAFARLAHALLLQVDGPARPVAAKISRLRRPRSLARKPWRWMKEALQRQNQRTAQHLLEYFAHTRHHTAILAPRRTLLRSALIGASLLAGFAAMASITGYMLRRETVTRVDDRTPNTPLLSTDGGSVQDQPLLSQPDDGVATVQVNGDPATNPAAVATARRDVLDFAQSIVRVSEDQRVATVVVRRSGTLQGPVTFMWSTEAGTAQVGQDFTAVPLRWEVIGDGARTIELHVPLPQVVNRQQSRAFYVRIDRAGKEAVLGSRRLVQIDLLPTNSAAGDSR